MSEPTHEWANDEVRELFQDLTAALEESIANAQHWPSENCPICQTSLKPLDSPYAGFINLQLQTGHCLECGLSPAEVRAEEIGQYVWLRVPITIGLADFIKHEGTVRTQGATVREAINFIDAKHPGFKNRLLVGPDTINGCVDMSVNGVYLRRLQGLDTPIKGGDYLKIHTVIAAA